MGADDWSNYKKTQEEINKLVKQIEQARKELSVPKVVVSGPYKLPNPNKIKYKPELNESEINHELKDHTVSTNFWKPEEEES